MKIVDLIPRLILNSQGRKAVECTVRLNNGSIGAFAPPEGTSVGKYEAKATTAEVALEQIKQITPELLKISDLDQERLDDFLNKQHEIGANAALAISLSFAIAADTLGVNKSIKSSTFYKPKLMVLFFEGGVHSSSQIGIQEFMLVYEDIIKAAADYNNLRRRLIQDGHFINSGMEGAMVSEKITDEEALELLAGSKIALDVGGQYLQGTKIDLMTLPEKYSIVSIEDPYPEDNIKNWRKLFQRWGQKILIVGDDLTVTDKNRIKTFANNAINAVIIKPNQQRTLTDTLAAVKIAKKAGLKIIVSHRSGETNQTFIADLAVAIEADYVKFGAPIRGERVVKYNRLLDLTNS